MKDNIKSLITRIEQLESGDDSVGSGIELGKLYGKMKEFGWIWDTRGRMWIYDYINSDKEDSVSIPKSMESERDK